MSTEREKVEQLKGQEDVRRALKQTATTKATTKPVVETRQKVWIGTYVSLLLGLGGLFYLIRLGFFNFAGKYLSLLQRFTLGAMAIVLVLAAFHLLSIYVIGRLDDAISQYNLKRILRLAVSLIIVFIIISMLFAN